MRKIHYLVMAVCVLAVVSCSRPEKTAEIHVKKGMTASTVGRILHERQVISSLLWWKILCKVKPGAGRIQTGYYRFSTEQGAGRMIDALIKGDVVTITFTVEEGFSNRQIRDLFTSRSIMTATEFKRWTTDPALLKQYRIPAPSLEGYLYPETYKVPKGAAPRDVIEPMARLFFATIDDKYRARAKKLAPLSGFHEAVILASIVEKEARAADERSTIAAVFLNRLKIGKKLQSCATVQYILGKPKKRLLNKDVRIQHPYNTYVNKGLPPGPICNPGKASLLAVMYPAKVDYLYFRRNPDSREGRHFFSRTYAEHQRKKTD